MNAPDEATRAQLQAADPRTSTWVSANAGSGKTRVLIDRVTRLLFLGCAPEKILCLTYTTAAAAEMQNRLFERLGRWAMLPDAELRATLRELGEADAELSGQRLPDARRLFARALETPGGLKIQTIHSFCDGLLRRFPMEAGVTPQFEIIDDRVARSMRLDILDRMADGGGTGLLDRLAAFHAGDDPDGLLTEIIGKRDAFARCAGRGDAAEPAPMQAILADAFAGDAAELLRECAGVMRTGSVTDRKNAERFEQAATLAPSAAALGILEAVLLFTAASKAGAGAPKIDALPTAAIRRAWPGLQAQLNDLMLTVAAAAARRKERESFEKTLALRDFAAAFLADYDRRKLAGGYLDYDDLIRKAGELLARPGVSDWILYRLDGGVDHILIDEAQDTSPEQWAIIRSLEAEFTAGYGGRDAERTLFVVGDEKQSIYSFQGADPEKFGAMKAFFAGRQARVGRTLADRNLLYSFRSAPEILALTDMVCGSAPMFADPGIPDEPQETGVRHLAFRSGMPGRIDLWDFIEAEGTEADAEWYDPVDLPAPGDPRNLLAENLAAYLDALLAEGRSLPGTGRALSAGDILILVQRRSLLFHAVIRELKARNLPVAGADRMEVGAELAVRDILSLLKFAATPSDDLSLAEALRSPLFGLSEQDLFTLAHGREGSLYGSLLASGARHRHVRACLTDCVAKAHSLRPYELVERILTRHGGRRGLLARLGDEARDGIDELVSQALRYERTEPPTLTGFLSWFELGRIDVKRRTQDGLDQIRVMTVHGAKGLEAPFVILPDTAAIQPHRGGQILVMDDGLPVWKPRKEDATAEQLQAMETQRRFEERERNRLLYVAMTRAINRLLVCGAGRLGKEESPCWYDRMAAAMAALGAVPETFPGGMTGSAFRSPAWTEEAGAAVAAEAVPDAGSPGWIGRDAAPAETPPPTLAPSGLGGEAALARKPGSGADRAGAMEFGTRVHALLEHLPRAPREAWPDVARRVAGHDGDTEADAALALVEKILEAPEFRELFAPDTLAEVAVTAELDALGGRRIAGYIDRLVVGDHRILAVDYKTNAEVPARPEDVPAGLLRQMGAYASALAGIYPGRRIDVAFLWTSAPALMELPSDLVMRHLREADAERA